MIKLRANSKYFLWRGDCKASFVGEPWNKMKKLKKLSTSTVRTISHIHIIYIPRKYYNFENICLCILYVCTYVMYYVIYFKVHHCVLYKYLTQFYKSNFVQSTHHDSIYPTKFQGGHLTDTANFWQNAYLIQLFNQCNIIFRILFLHDVEKFQLNLLFYLKKQPWKKDTFFLL